MDRLSLFHERQSGKGAGQAVQNGILVESGKFQFRHGGANKVYAGDELFQFVIEQWQLKIAFATGRGEAAAGRGGGNLALVLVMDQQIAKPRELHRGYALVRAVKEMLHLDMDVLGKRFLNPLAVDRAGEAEKRQVFRAPRRA